WWIVGIQAVGRVTESGGPVAQRYKRRLAATGSHREGSARRAEERGLRPERECGPLEHVERGLAKDPCFASQHEVVAKLDCAAVDERGARPVRKSQGQNAGLAGRKGSRLGSLPIAKQCERQEEQADRNADIWQPRRAVLDQETTAGTTTLHALAPRSAACT